MTESSLSRILKRTGIFGGAQLIYVLLSMLRSKFTAVLLSVVGIGLIDAYSRCSEMMGAATNLGLSQGAVQRIATLHERRRHRALRRYVCSLRSWALLAALLGVSVTLLLSPLLAMSLFGDSSRWFEVALLSPIVACSALMGSEQALLKGLQQVRRLVWLTLFTATSSLLIAVLSYALWGLSAVLPSLVVTSLFNLCFHYFLSLRLFRYAVSFRLATLRRGLPMLRLGVAFAAASFLASGSEFAVRSFMLWREGFSDLGLYAAGFTLMVSYSRFLFMAMDADFYPRLSTVVGDVARQNHYINQQIQVLILLIAPLLLLFALLLPLAVRLLYTPAFLSLVPLLTAALFFPFFKALSTPIAYLSLSHVRSRIYFCMEGAYSLFFIVLVSASYHLGGLRGAGWGLSLSYLSYFLLVWQIYARRFAFVFHPSVLRCSVCQALLLLLGVVALNGFGAFQPFVPIFWGRWVVVVCFLCSLGYSLRLFSREATLPPRLARLFSRNSKPR